jgi:hypothetical protein
VLAICGVRLVEATVAVASARHVFHPETLAVPPEVDAQLQLLVDELVTLAASPVPAPD